jgi:hypothetical protein
VNTCGKLKPSGGDDGVLEFVGPIIQRNLGDHLMRPPAEAMKTPTIASVMPSSTFSDSGALVSPKNLGAVEHFTRISTFSKDLWFLTMDGSSIIHGDY